MKVKPVRRYPGTRIDLSKIKPVLGVLRSPVPKGKVPIKRKMLPQTPVGMANAPTSAKYIPPRKTRKSSRL